MAWEIGPGRQAVLMVKDTGSSAGGGSGKINVIVTWVEELKFSRAAEMAASLIQMQGAKNGRR